MIEYRAGALRDLRGVRSYFARYAPHYDEKFFARLRDTLRGVESMPLSFPVAFEANNARVHKARILRTKYSIAFVIVGDGHVAIVALTHGKRRPGWWARRLQEPG
jgi:plasmid stabilization system protein ParE